MNEAAVDPSQTRIAFLGLGEMGGPMAGNLAASGWDIKGYDLLPERLSAARTSGVGAAPSVEEALSGANVVLTSLPSAESWAAFAESRLLPLARPGMVFVDFGTAVPADTRRLAREFGLKGSILLDVPVSGGPDGARNRRLYMFAGGDRETVERVRPLLEAVGGPDHITWCGPAGSGHAVKGVNQLAMGLGVAAYMEAVAFGVREGIEPAVIGSAVAGEHPSEHWRAMVAYIVREVAQGNGDALGVKIRELPYFLREAAERGFELPLTSALRARLENAPRTVVDDHRPAPSFWLELVRTA